MYIFFLYIFLSVLRTVWFFSPSTSLTSQDDTNCPSRRGGQSSQQQNNPPRLLKSASIWDEIYVLIIIVCYQSPTTLLLTLKPSPLTHPLLPKPPPGRVTVKNRCGWFTVERRDSSAQASAVRLSQREDEQPEM